MKKRLLTLASAFAFASAVMAQEPEAEAAAPEAAQPAYESAAVAEPAQPSPAEPAAAEPAVEASGEETDFGAIRARAYDVVGNRAATPTVATYVGTPYMLHGKKLVYAEPTNGYAALSFGEGLTKFLVFDNNQGLGMATVGVASKGFGASVGYALGKRWRFDEDKRNGGATTEQSTGTVTAGDLVQATFAMPLGAIDLTARAYWLTWRTETDTETERRNGGTTTKTETDQDYWDYGAEVTVGNDPSAKDLFWSVGALFSRRASEVKTKAGGTTTRTNAVDAYVTVQPNVDVGMPVLKSANARVLLGANVSVPVTVYDGADNDDAGVEDSRFAAGLVAVPNVLGELGLGKCWLVFAGAAYAWDVLDVDRETYVTGAGTAGKRTQTTTLLTMRTNAAFVNGGARFQYRDFAVEASVANSFFNNPLEGFNGTNFVANLGGFIYF